MWKKSKTPEEGTVQNLKDRLEDESVANTILRATLKWYAERKHYNASVSEDKPLIMYDEGVMARGVLRGAKSNWIHRMLRKETKSNLQKAEEILNQISDKSNPTHLKKLVDAYYSEK